MTMLQQPPPPPHHHHHNPHHQQQVQQQQKTPAAPEAQEPQPQSLLPQPSNSAGDGGGGGGGEPTRLDADRSPDQDPSAQPLDDDHLGTSRHIQNDQSQQFQSASDVSTILSMPPNVLSQLARASDREQQRRTIVNSHLDLHLLAIMSFSVAPPSPHLQQQLHHTHHNHHHHHHHHHHHQLQANQKSDPAPRLPGSSQINQTSSFPSSSATNQTLRQASSSSSSSSSSSPPSASSSSSPLSHGLSLETTPSSTQSSISHPAIPHILHQVFSPNSAVILAPVTETSPRAHEYQPSFRSVDEWAIQVAQQTAAVTAIDHQFTSYIASQLKLWALHSQDSQLDQLVRQSKHNALLLAARAEAVLRDSTRRTGSAATSNRDHQHPPRSPKLASDPIRHHQNQIPINNINQERYKDDCDDDIPLDQQPLSNSNSANNLRPLPDLTPYANAYKSQLATIAAGYYTHLHREAINMLNQSSSVPTSSSSTSAQFNSSNNIHHHPHPHQHLQQYHHPIHRQFDPTNPQQFLDIPPPDSTLAALSDVRQQQHPPGHTYPLQQYIQHRHSYQPQQPLALTQLHPQPYSPHHTHPSYPSPIPQSPHQQRPPPSFPPQNPASTSSPPSSSSVNGCHPSSSNMTNTNFNTSQNPSSNPYDKLITRNVQAAAVAALTANVMAATEIASRAGQTLSNLGMTIHTDLTTPLPPSGPAAIAATQRTLALAQAQHPNQSPSSPSTLEISAALMSHSTTSTSSYPSSSLQQQHALHRNSIGPTPGHFHSQINNSHPSSASPNSLGAQPARPQSSHPLHPNGTHQTNSYTAQVEKMWRLAQEGQCTERSRDYLLSFAHAMYSKKSNDPSLLTLLHTLVRLHPSHLPTLLLLSCVYYSQGDYVSSLLYNDQILSIDPEYVEAMSNVGTTQRALGKFAEAEEWWWRAITLRPTYFDAFDNLLGVLCHPQAANNPSAQSQSQPRYTEALRLCKFVETAIFGPEDQIQRPIRLPSVIPATHVHRVQNLFYAKGNLLMAAHRSEQARDEYEKALEIVLGQPIPKGAPAQLPETGAYSLIDLVLAVTSIGLFMMALNASETGTVADPIVFKTLSNTGIWDPSLCGIDAVLADPLKAAKERRHIIRNRLLRMGGGILPCVLLLPDSLDQLVSTVFNASGRVLPVFKNYLASHGGSNSLDPIRNPVFQPPNHTTSTALLTLAKFLQDSISAHSSGNATTSVEGIPPSPSLLLSLYYVAITLHPSPSTYNNLGILLSTIPSILTLNHGPQGRQVMTGQQVAHTFYLQGLQKDNRHPHLYTNLGSLLKDMGQLPQAVAMYEKAVQFNPNFDVALANLANAIKDMGRVQESVQWYKRAVAINPNFPEAVCGLVNALGGVCDWRDRGAVGHEPVVDASGKLLGPPAPAPDGKLRAGLMGKVSRLIDKQLDEGMSYGKGIMKQTASLEHWLEAIAFIKTGRPDASTADLKQKWQTKLEPFFGAVPESRPAATRTAKFNEGGFLIRLIERCTRQSQRRLYVDTYGLNFTSSTEKPVVANLNDGKRGGTSIYRRLTLPSALSVPPVPTVLPFHTFTYPLTARECRLISHRNALRISLTTLNQPWIPSTIYPPPPPPFPTDPDGLPRVRVGYVSSDFNNHPLAHLTQSVFGMHDQSRFKVFCYATSASDGSIYRKKIQDEVEVFKDVSNWNYERVVNEIVTDQIHILVNLNGYTKGARNEIFAARPCPIQIGFMGFAGTLASGWTDWIIADPVVCPPRMVSGEKWRKRHHICQTEPSGAPLPDVSTQQEEPRFLELEDDGPSDFEGDLDPESLDEDWVYTEKFIYMPHSYFVCDHKQGFRDESTYATTDLNGVPVNLKLDASSSDRGDAKRQRAWEEEEVKRWTMRKETFPDIDDETVIFANFNQLYKIDPLVFKYWLEILAAVPNSILWLLRFPAPGEPHLKMTAEKWAGREVASRVRFTDVAPKPVHIQRGRVADLFLDSTECNAHTTAADILWSATPMLTLPRRTHAHKMCSRVASSIALATGYGLQMIATSMEDYKRRAVDFASTLRYLPNRTQAGNEYRSGEIVPGGLIKLRKNLFFSRENSILFNTEKWTKNLEQGYLEAWRRFVLGLDDEETTEWKECEDLGLKKSCSIWLKDDDDSEEVRRVNLARQEFMIRENHLTGRSDQEV